jgi:O-glycosyl hydrolase
MKLLTSILAAVLLWPFTIFAQTDTTQAEITLLKSKRYQTMEDIGGNYCQARYRDHAWDEVGQFALETLKPKYVRFALPLRKWEPENDNDRPNSIDLSKFQYNEVMLSLFDMLKTMKEEYGVVNFVASVWDGPVWMIANPEERQQRKIKPEMYREVLESVAAFMLVARDEYGVEIDYFSFNEATGGYQILFTPEEIIEFMKIGGPYFRKFGFKTNFLTADAHSTATCVEYAKPILATEELHPYLGPLSYHSWWSDRIGNDVFQEIADLADQYNLPVWCTELGYDAMLYKQEGDPYKTWENGWRLAKVTHRAIKHSKATVTHYWTYQNNFPLLREADSPFPAYYAMKHFADYLPGGTTIVEARKSDPDLWVFAGTKGQDYTMLNVLNTASYTKTITFQNLPDQTFHWIFTNEEGNMMQQRDSFEVEEGSFTVEVPPFTINTFTTKIAE